MQYNVMTINVRKMAVFYFIMPSIPPLTQKEFIFIIHSFYHRFQQKVRLKFKVNPETCIYSLLTTGKMHVMLKSINVQIGNDQMISISSQLVLDLFPVQFGKLKF